jgi:gliding motility-associated-like protein
MYWRLRTVAGESIVKIKRKFASMKFLFAVYSLFIFSVASAQQQACPLNSNFSFRDLTHWAAYTGTFRGAGFGRAVGDSLVYDSVETAPNGTIGRQSIAEYELDADGIQVISSTLVDPYGNFATIPNINGYQYTGAVLIGSTNISRNGGGGGPGGYVRGIRYLISVPPGPVTQPYTMTYAYAMVLENGQHNTDQQPWFSATLVANDTVVTCATRQYDLPTDNNAGNNGGSAILDTAAAESNGFLLSRLASPNTNPNGATGSGHLRDVWYKGWSEVTFDLSPYRGRQVILTFEVDNCVPGGHFAYSYIALRNACNGLEISGNPVACIGSSLTYSIPALGGASYAWSVPPGWSIVSGTDSNILRVTPGATGGLVTAHEINGCADLRDTLVVSTTTPTIPGTISGSNEVCAQNNSSVITLNGNSGKVLNWVSSTDGINWLLIPDSTSQYVALNLDATTIFEAQVQNGSSCDIDSTNSVKITVDPKTVGGTLLPANQVVCTGQNKDALLTLENFTGSVLNWQTSPDGVNWSDFAPVYTDSVFDIVAPAITTDYRILVKSGVCPMDTSSVAGVVVVPALFPQANAEPADTTICYGASAKLNAVITIGTNYNWNNSGTLANQGNGNITAAPFVINAVATPLTTTDYVLSIVNAGCPNPLLDTFAVHVIPPIIVNAGNDTSIVINQPLQLHAVSNDPGDVFTWAPPFGLSNPDIADPIAIFNSETDSITYRVKATSPAGCFGIADIKVTVFRTLPDIFVPNAFTPGNNSNNLFRPIPVGIASLQYFRVYNRWGQLVYSTSVPGDGWDGKLNGHAMDSGSYVWMVKGTSYLGKIIQKKGVMVLVR